VSAASRDPDCEREEIVGGEQAVAHMHVIAQAIADAIVARHLTTVR
jgi:hypothetical protein